MIKGRIQEMIRRVIGIGDTPERIAGGVSLGVFLGVMPWTGPIAAVVLAQLLRLNKAAALAAAVASNTWTSLLLVGVCAGIGGWLVGRVGGGGGWWRVILQTMVGFVLVSALLALVAYPLTLYAVRSFHRRRRGGAQ